VIKNHWFMTVKMQIVLQCRFDSCCEDGQYLIYMGNPSYCTVKKKKKKSGWIHELSRIDLFTMGDKYSS